MSDSRSFSVSYKKYTSTGDYEYGGYRVETESNFIDLKRLREYIIQDKNFKSSDVIILNIFEHI